MNPAGLPKYLLSCCYLLIAGTSYCQNDSTESPLKISGYADVYYCYDFGNPENHTRPGFIYSYNRHNEVNVNLAFVHLAYAQNGVRSNFALMAGTYAQYNLAAEPPIFQHVLEASVGVKVSKQKDIWIDAGIMPSHLGAETPIGKNCWNLTRSISADNSPYYETGLRFSYADRLGNWLFAAYVLNGWQRIQRLPYNQTPAFGTQVTYKTAADLTLNWSTFIGNEFPDSAQRWRYFNDIYGQFVIGKQFSLLTGFDIGLQQQSKHSPAFDVWYAPLLMVRYSMNNKITLAARAEYYFDEKGVIIKTGTANGFQTFGYSANLDLFLTPNVLWRSEARAFNSRDAVFIDNGQAVGYNVFATTALLVSF